MELLGSEFQVGGETKRTEAGAGACGSTLRRDTAETAISSPEASGTRTGRSLSSFAGAFAVTSSGSIIHNGGVT